MQGVSGKHLRLCRIQYLSLPIHTTADCKVLPVKGLWSVLTVYFQ